MLKLLLGVVMISLSAVWVKLVNVDPTAAAFYSMLSGGMVLLVWSLWCGDKLLPRRAVFIGLAAAALFFALDLALWHRSILFVGPGIATLLANFQVILLALAGVLLFGERADWRFAGAIGLALVGLVMLVGGEWASLSDNYKWGVVLGLLTAVCYAAYVLSLRNARVNTASLSPRASIALLSLVCAAMLLLMTIGLGESLAIPRWQDAGWLLVYGITAQVLGWGLISQSLPGLPASKVGLLLLLQPVCAFIWDAVFFNRAFSVLELTGAAVALVGIYLGTLKRQDSAA
ncbi:MAG TPA: DMT family transporter [Gammaproteobacteria bacterium]|nr:DMT family transporter [Gammaproteobacteria bacterium]